MTADLSCLRQTLLGLLAASPAALPELSPDDWERLDGIAALHRLQPLLHHRHRDNPAIPAATRAEWQAEFRRAATDSLILGAELTKTAAMLEEAGLAPIALKGAWLAWHAYPHPALRPMRDIDLLLTSDTVVAGFELLRGHGYVLDGPLELSLDDVIRLDKHMPPLISPRGVTIELHHRLWEIDGRMDHAAPADDEGAIRARAIRSGALAYLAPQDLLAHLIIHAIYDHRLDCGPLVLSDVSFLLQRSEIDWGRFWAEAAAGQWQRGAQLVLSLVRAHDPAAPVIVPAGLPPVPADLDALAADLLLQELETRRSAGVFATLAASGTKSLMMRIFARRHGGGETHTVRRDLGEEGGFAVWAGSRLTRTVRELARRDVRRQSLALARLSRWLDA
jgi:hypothetical protein